MAAVCPPNGHPDGFLVGYPKVVYLDHFDNAAPSFVPTATQSVSGQADSMPYPCPSCQKVAPAVVTSHGSITGIEGILLVGGQRLTYPQKCRQVAFAVRQTWDVASRSTRSPDKSAGLTEHSVKVFSAPTKTENAPWQELLWGVGSQFEEMPKRDMSPEAFGKDLSSLVLTNEVRQAASVSMLARGLRIDLILGIYDAAFTSAAGEKPQTGTPTPGEQISTPSLPGLQRRYQTILSKPNESKSSDSGRSEKSNLGIPPKWVDIPEQYFCCPLADTDFPQLQCSLQQRYKIHELKEHFRDTHPGYLDDLEWKRVHRLCRRQGSLTAYKKLCNVVFSSSRDWNYAAAMKSQGLSQMQKTMMEQCHMYFRSLRKAESIKLGSVYTLTDLADISRLRTLLQEVFSICRRRAWGKHLKSVKRIRKSYWRQRESVPSKKMAAGEMRDAWIFQSPPCTTVSANTPNLEQLCLPTDVRAEFGMMSGCVTEAPGSDNPILLTAFQPCNSNPAAEILSRDAASCPSLASGFESQLNPWNFSFNFNGQQALPGDDPSLAFGDNWAIPNPILNPQRLYPGLSIPYSQFRTESSPGVPTVRPSECILSNPTQASGVDSPDLANSEVVYDQSLHPESSLRQVYLPSMPIPSPEQELYPFQSTSQY